jgi:hypothetical protein
MNQRIPNHRITLYLPHGQPAQVSETFPIGKDAHTGYCIYCYSTHSNWWRMADADYFVSEEQRDGNTMLLCGECEYTSMKCFT